MSDDMIGWLRRQLDDDERVANCAAPGPWEYQNIESVGGGRICDPKVEVANVRWDNDRVDPRIRRSVSWGEADKTGEHIARHDPARALREVEAKRLRIELIQAMLADDPEDATALYLAQLEALPYADREGYRPEWSPT